MALALHPVPMLTALRVMEIVNSEGLAKDGKPIANGSAETRLMELVRLRLVISEKIPTSNRLNYWITERGVQVLNAGEDGVALIKQMNAKVTQLEKDRAVDQAPLVNYWLDHTEQQLKLFSDELFSSAKPTLRLPPLG